MALTILAFWLVFSVAGSSSRVTQSHHGLHHAAYGYQILNGILPPTNPSSLGMPANFYWGWHALLAGTAWVFGISIFEASLWVNALALASLLGILWFATGRFTRSAWTRAAFCLLPFLVLNPVGVAQLSLRSATALAPALARQDAAGEGGVAERVLALARHHPALEIHSGGLDPLLPRGPLLGGLELHDRLASLINKFFNFNSFPAALALFALCVVCLSDDRLSERWRYSLIVLGSAGMALFSPLPVLAFGFYVFAHCLVCARESWPRLRAGSSGGGLGEKLRSSVPCWAPALAAACGVVLALPLLLPVAAAFGGEIEVHADARSLGRHGELMGWAFLPALPVYLVAGLRLARLPASLRVHWLAGLLLAAATLLLSIPKNDPNEYKLALMSSIPSTLLLLGLAASLDPGLLERFPRWRFLRGLAVGALVLGGAAALASASLIYLASDWAEEDPYRYEGRDMVLRSEDGGPLASQRQEAYRWLRSETPAQAFVLQEPVAKDELELSVLAQRRVVAALPSMFTASIAHQQALVVQVGRVVSKLGACILEEADLEGLFALPAPWPEAIYALVAVPPLRDRAACARPPGVETVFSNQAFEIFRIAVPGQG